MAVRTALAGRSVMDTLRVQYAKTNDGVQIAYTVFSEGVPLVIAPVPPQQSPSDELALTFDACRRTGSLRGRRRSLLTTGWSPETSSP